MEATVNKVEISGFLGKDAEIRKFEKGRTLTSLSVATSESYKNQKGEWVSNTTWHNVTMWKSPDPEMVPHLKKGARVNVNGKLSTRKYTDKNGQTRYITEVIAGKIEVAKENILE